MVELLKQGEHVPMAVEKQVIVLFAGTAGHLDDIPVANVLKFEENFIKYIETNKPEILKEIKDKKEISDDLKKALVEIIEKFKKERM